MTSLDTPYEYAGFQLAGLLHEALQGVGLPLILGLAGVAFVVHRVASDRAPIRDLAVHVLSLVLMVWLLSPVAVRDVRAPRLLVYLGAATDLLQERAVKAAQERFLEAPFQWERVAALVSFARILDPAVARDAAEFLEACAKPALARSEPRATNLFREGALPYGEACERRRADLWTRLRQHVETEPLHRQALEAGRRQDPGGSAAFRERYLEEVARRAVDDPGSPTHETSLVLASLGGYSHTDPAQSTGGLPTWAKVWMTASVPLLGIASFVFGDEAADAAVSGAAELHQGWANRFSAKQKYFLATTFGPHVYGLALMLLLGLFPVAGLFALLPGKWGALVNFGKVFVSVKLWPVGWAALSTFNARRSSLEAFDAPERASHEVFFALASMYLVTPAVAFLIVHLAAAAAAFPFSGAVPPPAGPGAGPAGPAARIALARSK